MGIVDRVLQCQWRRLVNNNNNNIRHISSSSEAKRVVGGGSPCLLLPPGVGIQMEEDNKEMRMMMSLFFLNEEKEEKGKEEERLRRPAAASYSHFLDLGKILPRICDIDINTRTMWRGRYLSPEKGLAEYVGSSRGWAAFLDRETCDFYLFNFWIPKKSFCFPYIPLPPIETLPTILTRETTTTTILNTNNNLNTISTKTEFLCPQQTHYVSSSYMTQDLIKRLALSRAPTPLSYTTSCKKNIINIDEDEEEEEEEAPMVMIIYGGSVQDGQLAFCKLGDVAWTSLHHHNYSTTTSRFPYEDITYFSPHRKFYALTNSQNLEAWDLSCPSAAGPQVKILKIHSPAIVTYADRTMYLVESDGKLMMVIRHYHGETVSFDVFELTEEELDQGISSCTHSWMKITSLNDRILFVGVNDSVSLPSYECPGLIPNSIYFTSLSTFGGDGILGVYHLKDDTIFWFKKARISPSPTWIFPSKTNL